MRVGTISRHAKPVENITDLRFFQVIAGCLHVSYGSGPSKTTVIYNQEDWESIKVVGEGDPGEKD